MRQLNDVVWSVDAHNDHLTHLLDRMRDYAFEVLQPAGVEVRFAPDPDVSADHLPVLVRRNRYLIFKEALHNVIKHAHARHVAIALTLQQGRLVLLIEDDGRPVATGGHVRASGHGLRNIGARAEAAGGEARCEARAEGGFRVRVSVPWQH